MNISDRRKDNRVPLSKLKVGTYFIKLQRLYILTDIDGGGPFYYCICLKDGCVQPLDGYDMVQPVDINIDIVENLKV